MRSKRGTLLAGVLALSGWAWGLPEGAQVQAGNVQTQAAGSSMTIQQMSDRAIINWNGFSIGANELVRVLQPNQAAILLNRVTGQDPSTILGQLNANGNIWLLNPNGILFGPGSQINVGGLLASTLNLTDRDFLAGRYNFSQAPDKPLAAVVNQGELHIAPNGYLVLAAPLVSNEGLIVANLGKVALLAGDQMSISLDSEGLVNYRLAAAGPAAGPVLLSPEMVSDVLRSVVQRGDIAEANLITQSDGRIFLGNGGGVALQAGTAQTSHLVIDSQNQTMLRSGSLTSVGNGEAMVLSQGGTWAQRGSVLEAREGFAEISGKRLAAAGTVELGSTGRLLLDPAFLTIVSGSGNLDQNPIGPADNPGGTSTVGTDFLQTLAGGFIQLQADDTLTISALTEPLILSGATLELTATTGDVVFLDPNTVISTTGGGESGIFISAGRDIILGQLQTDYAGLSAGRDIVSAAPLAADTYNVSAYSLDVNANRNINLNTAISLLEPVTAGNVTLVNQGNLNVISVNAAETANLRTLTGSDIVLAGTLTAGNSVVVDSGANLQAYLGGGPLITAPDVTLRASQNMILTSEGQPPVPPLVSSTNLALSAGGQINGPLTLDSPAFAISVGSGSINLLLDGDHEIVNFGGVNGLSTLNGGVDLLVNMGQLRISAPIVASTIALRATGDISQAPGVSMQNDYLFLDGQADVDVSTSGLFFTSSILEAHAVGNLTVHSNGNEILSQFRSDNGDARLHVNGSMTMQAPVRAPGVMSVNVTANLNNQVDGPIAQGGQLALRAATFSGSPIETSVAVLAADTGASLSLEQLGHLEIGTVDGLNGVRSNGDVQVTINQTDSPGGLDVTAPVSAQNVNLTVNDGDLAIQSTITGTTAVQLDVTAGNLLLTGAAVATPTALLNVNQNVTGTGAANLLADQLTVVSGGVLSASGGAFSGPVQNLNLQAPGNITYSSANSTLVTQLTSQTGNVSLQVQGDLATLNPIHTIDLASITASGAVTATGTFIEAAQLELRAGDVTTQLLIDTPLLAASSTGNLNLLRNGALTVGNVGTLSGAAAVNTLNLTVASDLQLAAPLSATTVQLNVPGVLDNSLVGASVLSNRLELNAGSQSGNLLQVDTRALTLQGSGNLTLDTLGTLNLLNGNVANNLTLTAHGDTTVSGPLQAGNISLSATGADLAINGPGMTALEEARVNVSGGNLSLAGNAISAPTAVLTLSNDLNGGGTVRADQLTVSAGGTVNTGGAAFSQPSQTVDLSATNGLTFNGANSTVVQNASSSSGNVNLDILGDLQVNAPITSADLIQVTVTGSPTAAGLFAQSPRLSLQAGDVTQLLNLNVGVLSANSNGNLNLAQAAPLTVGTIGANSGLQAANALNLTTTALQLDAPISGQAVDLEVQGNLNNSQTGTAITAQSLALDVGSQTGLPLGINTRSLTGSSGAALELFSTGTLDLQALTVATQFALTGDADTLVSGPLQAADISLRLTQGNLNLQSPSTALQGANTVAVLLDQGLLTLNGPSVTAPTVSLQAAAGIQGNGSPAPVRADQLTVNSSAGSVNLDFDRLLAAQTTLTAAASGDLTLNGASSVALQSAQSSTGNTRLNVSGDLRLDGAAQAANLVALNVTGNLDNANAGPGVSAQQLALRAGSTSGATLRTSVQTLAAQSGGNLDLTQTGALNIGSVDGLNGVQTTGQLNLNLNGNTLVTQGVQAGNLSLQSAQGDLTLQNTLQSGDAIEVNLAQGSLQMTGPSLRAPRVAVQTSGNIQGDGLAPHIQADQLTVNSSAGSVNLDFDRLLAAQTTLTAAASGDLTLNGAGAVALQSAQSSNGNTRVNVTGDLRLEGPAQAANLVALNVTGNLDNANAGPGVSAQQLALRAGSTSGSTLRTSVQTLAAQSGGNLDLTQTGALNIGSVDGLNGVQTTGQLNLTVNGGDLSLSGNAITAPTAVLTLSNDLNGGGTVRADQLTVSAGGTVNTGGAAFSQPSQTVDLSATNDLTFNGANSTVVQNASSSSGNVTLNILGDLQVNAPITSADLVQVTVTGSPTAAGLFAQSPRLSLQAGDVTQLLNLNVGVLSANSNGNLNLAQAAPLTVGTIGANSGLQAANALNLTTTALQLDAPISGQAVDLDVQGNLNNSQTGTAITAQSLALDVGSQTGLPLGINTRSLTGSSGAALELFSTGTLDLQALTVATQFALTGDADTLVSGPVQAADISLRLTQGNLNLQSPSTALQGSNTVAVLLDQGLLTLNGPSLTAPTVSLQAAAGIQGNGSPAPVRADQLTVNSSAGSVNLDFDRLLAAQTTLTAAASGDLTLNGASSVALQSAQSSNGSTRLNVTGDLRLEGAAQAANLVALNVTGNLDNANAGPGVSAQQLALRAGSTSGATLRTSVQTLAAQSGGNLDLTQTGALNIGSVDGLNGVQTTGQLNLNLNGNTLVTQGVQAGNLSLQSAQGDLTLQNTLQSGDAIEVNLAQGSLQMTGPSLGAPRVAVQTSGNIQGDGLAPNIQADQLDLASSTGSIAASLDRLNADPVTVTATAPGDIDLTSARDLNVAASGRQLNLSTPGNLTVTSTLQATQSANLQVGNTLSFAGSGPLLSAPTLLLQAGNGGPIELDVDSLSAGGATLTLLLTRPNVQLQALTGTDLSVSGAGNVSVTGPLQATNLNLGAGQNLDFQASAAATTAVLTAGGDLTTSAAPLDVRNLRLNVNGSVGSAATPLSLAGTTQVAGTAGQNLHLRSQTGLQIGAVSGATGVQTGPNSSTTLEVQQGNLQIQQNLTAPDGSVRLQADNGAIQGGGVVRSRELAFRAGGAVELVTDVRALAGAGSNVTVRETDQSTQDGLRLTQTGVSGNNVSITVEQGNLDLGDPSLGDRPAVNATTQATLIATAGSIQGTPGKVNVQSPLTTFQAGGSVGTPAVPVLIPRDSDFNASNPSNVQVFPPLPPSPVLEIILPSGSPNPTTTPIVVPGNITLSDSTSLGITVGTLPTLTLRALGARDDAAALYQISWNIPGEGSGTQTFSRTYLLDFTLEQLLSQPVNARFLSLSLEELLNQPVLSPMLEKTLEELLQEDLNGD